MEEKTNSIDVIALIKTIWSARKKVIKWAIAGFAIGVAIAFSIPKQYAATVKLAPETQAKALSGSVGTLASMMGISTPGGSDGVDEKMYPEIIKSTPFLLEFAQIDIPYQKQTIPLNEFILKHKKHAWWSYVFGLPSMAIGWVVNIGSETKTVSTFDSSQEMQDVFVAEMNQGITTAVDAKKGIITIATTFQNPEITKIIADSLVVKLQQYMTSYRTAKTKIDLDRVLVQFEEAKQKYYIADEQYAREVDRNQNLISQRAGIVLDRLRNERDLAYQVYSQLAQQVEVSRIKLQENTPVVTIIEPARLPIRAASPSKMMIIVAFTMLAAILCAAVIAMRSINEKQK